MDAKPESTHSVTLTINPTTQHLVVKYLDSPTTKKLTSNSGETAGIQVDFDSNNKITQMTFGNQKVQLERYAIRYSPQRDLLYIRLFKGKHDCSIELEVLDDDIIVDFDTENYVLGFAIIHSTQYFPADFLRKITPDWMDIPCVNIPEPFFIITKDETSDPENPSEVTVPLVHKPNSNNHTEKKKKKKDGKKNLKVDLTF